MLLRFLSQSPEARFSCDLAHCLYCAYTNNNQSTRVFNYGFLRKYNIFSFLSYILLMSVVQLSFDTAATITVKMLGFKKN